MVCGEFAEKHDGSADGNVKEFLTEVNGVSFQRDFLHIHQKHSIACLAKQVASTVGKNAITSDTNTGGRTTNICIVRGLWFGAILDRVVDVSIQIRRME